MVVDLQLTKLYELAVGGWDQLKSMDKSENNFASAVISGTVEGIQNETITSPQPNLYRLKFHFQNNARIEQIFELIEILGRRGHNGQPNIGHATAETIGRFLSFIAKDEYFDQTRTEIQNIQKSLQDILDGSVTESQVCIVSELPSIEPNAYIWGRIYKLAAAGVIAENNDLSRMPGLNTSANSSSIGR